MMQILEVLVATVAGITALAFGISKLLEFYHAVKQSRDKGMP